MVPIIIFGLLAVIIIGIFIYCVLPFIASPGVAGIVGVIVGGLITLLGSMVNSLIGYLRLSKETEEKIKDRISNHALELTRMDYELRQKSLELKNAKQQFLAPAKVYRTFYRALYKLHTTDDWPKEVETLGLLNIFELGPKMEKK